MAGGTIFISYRRGPDENAAGRLYEALEDKIGGQRLFMDVDGIRPGVDFVDDLNDKLSDCAAFLAIIGPNWIERQDELQNPDDFVRLEYAAVLARKDIPFIPIFFHDATMPAASDLPDELAGMVRRNGFSMPHEHFTSVLHGRLLPALSEIMGEDLSQQPTEPTQQPRSGGGALRIALIGAVVAGAIGLTALFGMPWIKSTFASLQSSAIGAPVLEKGSELSNFSRIDFSPDGKLIASGDGNLAAKIWDIETGAITTQLQGHTDRIETVVFSDDGQYLATAGQDNVARVWDLATNTEVALLAGHDDWIYSVDFSSDGNRLVTASADMTVRVWDWRTGDATLTFNQHQDEVEMAVFSPDDQTIATASVDETAVIWNATTGEALTTIEDLRSPVFAVAFSPDGTSLATASEDDGASIWDTFSGAQIATFPAHDDAVTGVAFTPDGRALATSSSDGSSRLWDVATGDQIGIFQRDEAEFYGIAISDDGRLFATATHTLLVVSDLK